MRKFFQRIDPYLRLGRYDKPIGGWLVFWPSAYGVALASSGGAVEPILYGAVLASSFITRSAGCAANDLFDRKLDKNVERTKDRPIASGELTVKQGLAFFVSQMTPFAAMAYIAGPNTTWIVPASMFILAAYPLSKRLLPWPQSVLGVAMNINLVLYHALITDNIPLYILPIYSGLWCWTMIYDSIYAYQDYKDDKKVGNKSTAISWENRYDDFCNVLAVGMAGSMFAGGYMAGLGPLYYPFMSVAIAHTTYTYKSLDTNSVKDCWYKFSLSHTTGLIMFLAFLLGKLTQKQKDQESVKVA